MHIMMSLSRTREILKGCEEEYNRIRNQLKKEDRIELFKNRDLDTII